MTVATAVPTARPAPVPAAYEPVLRAPARSRTASVDLVRGGVMVVMVLDHVRAFFTEARFDPTDLASTSAPLFLTRWVTHFCAPAFVLLAGLSAWFAGRRRSPRELSRFLLTRGLWLIVLELTVVSFAWYFNFEFAMGAFAQVIWAIGISMIALAGLVRLPRAVTAVVAGAMIAGHNLLDGVAPASLGALAPLWTALHVPGPLEVVPVFVAYPVIPWIGVMAAGYLLGPVFDLASDARRRVLLRTGVAMTAGFVGLRLLNVYGDAAPWAVQADALTTALSFLNTTKYPPSLLYLLMTLGPTLVVLALLERTRDRGAAGWVATFGRVPLFYYVAHLYVIHALVIAVAVVQGYGAGPLADVFLVRPDGFGFGLPVIYLLTAAVVLALYPLCRWYDGVKRRGTGWWWSYL